MALALSGEGEAPTDADPVAAVEAPPAAEELADVPSPSAEGPAVAPPPALSVEQVAEQVATVRSKQPDFLRKLAYWSLEESCQLPADLVGTLPSRNRSPETERPRVAVAARASEGWPESPAIAGAGLPAIPSSSSPAPRVRNPEKVRAVIGQLAGNPDPAIETTACRAIADALGDHKAASLGLFLGLCEDVRRGGLAEACLQDAFEEACGRGVRNRGAAFTASVARQ